MIISIPTLVGVLVLQVAIETTAIKKHRVNDCHGNDVVINCPPFAKDKDLEMMWQYHVKSTMGWRTVAKLDKENNQTFTNNTHLAGRLTIHRNGSLGIHSLKDKDSRLYRCQVRGQGAAGKRKIHLVELNLTCSGGTITKRQVCIEKDIVIDCKPKHNLVPMILGQVTWRKKSTRNNRLSWSRIKDTDTTLLHGNGSLWIRGGRYEGEKVYRCEVAKNVEGSRKMMHLTVVKDVVCRREKRQTEVSKQHLQVCVGEEVSLPCPALQHINISQVRSIKWRVRRTASPKHWQQLAQSKTVINKTIVVNDRNAHNATRLHDSKIDGVGLEANGSLWIKNIREIDEGNFECIVKIRHTHEPKRHTFHVKPIPCNHGDHAVNMTQQPSTVSQNAMQQENLIKTTNTTSTLAPSAAKPTSNSSQQEDSSDSQSQQSTSLPTSSSFQNTTTRILLRPSMETTTSTRSVIKPSIPTVHTTIVTTVTTSITIRTQKPTGNEEVMSDDVSSTGSKTVCGGSMTSVSGGFQSPNFPSAYPANSYCKWTISVPQDYTVIHITLDRMNLEHEDRCLNDYIAVYDELGNQVGSRQCGASDSPITAHVKGTKAVIEFKSDHSVEKTGFKLVYQSAK